MGQSVIAAGVDLRRDGVASKVAYRWHGKEWGRPRKDGVKRWKGKVIIRPLSDWWAGGGVQSGG